MEAGALIMPPGELQKLVSMEGKLTAFHVQLRRAGPGETPEQRIPRAQSEIEAALPGLRAVPAAERASIDQLMVMAHAAAWGTSLIALFMGALGIANTMAMSVFERTKEIGVQRPRSWKSQEVSGPVKYGARDCFAVKSTPGEQDHTHYGSVTSWIDTTMLIPVHIVNSARGAGVQKDVSYAGFRRFGGVWS